MRNKTKIWGANDKWDFPYKEFAKKLQIIVGEGDFSIEPYYNAISCSLSLIQNNSLNWSHFQCVSSTFCLVHEPK